MTNAITTAIARECRLSSACYLSFRVMARAAEFSPWLVRWRESHGRLIRVVQAGRCAVAAFIFKPDFVIFSPSALRTLTNAHQFARRETWLAPVHLWKCDEKLRFSLSSFSCSRFMKRYYLEIDERFPKLDAFADNAVSPRFEWTLVYLVEDKLSSGEIWFSFWAVFFFGSVIMFFRCFG